MLNSTSTTHECAFSIGNGLSCKYLDTRWKFYWSTFRHWYSVIVSSKSTTTLGMVCRIVLSPGVFADELSNLLHAKPFFIPSCAPLQSALKPVEYTHSIFYPFYAVDRNIGPQDRPKEICIRTECTNVPSQQL